MQSSPDRPSSSWELNRANIKHSHASLKPSCQIPPTSGYYKLRPSHDLYLSEQLTISLGQVSPAQPVQLLGVEQELGAVVVVVEVPAQQAVGFLQTAHLLAQGQDVMSHGLYRLSVLLQLLLLVVQQAHRHALHVLGSSGAYSIGMLRSNFGFIVINLDSR